MKLPQFCLLWLLCGQAWGQALVPRPLRGEADQPPLECQSQRVSIQVAQQVAHVRVEQVFVNRGPRDLEAVYAFPLQESASISSFSYWVHGKEIRAAIQEKQQARQMYEQVVAERRDPALLEHVGRNLFKINLFPVSPQEPMRVVVEYSQLCQYENGTVTFRYPLTASGQQMPIGRLEIDADIRDQKPIAGIQASSHGGVQTRLVNPHSAELHFEATRFQPRRDFQFQYRLQSSDFGVSFLTHRKLGEPGYFMLIVAPQEQVSKAQVVQKDVVFVMDRSGSMQGEKLQQAREALKFCLRKLSPNDRFRVLTFSGTVDSAPPLQPASPENVRRAADLVSALDIGDGTNISEALHEAMQSFGPGSNQKVVIFLTDGMPTEGETNAAKIAADVALTNRQAARLFAFGVGDDLDDYLLLKLASDHRGALQYVRAGESIESKIGGFFAKISTPLLVNLQLDFDGLAISDRYPAALPDIFKGSQLIVVGRYSGSGPRRLKLSGTINGQPRTFAYAAEFPEQNAANEFLPRLWAKERIDWACDQMRLHGENEELKNEVIGLSKRFTLMTPYTSFLALPEAERKRLAASSAGGYPTGGDPLLSVAAPADAHVTAYFPWGETRSLVYDPKSRLWKCRFIIPASVGHGVCKVAVVITLSDGHQQRQTVCFEADEEAPTGLATAHLKLEPGLGWYTEVQVETSPDTRRVMAQLANGKVLDLKKEAGRWVLRTAGRHRSLQVTLLDNGHNRTILTVEAR